MKKVAGIDPSLVQTGVAGVDGRLHTIKTGKLRGVERLAFLEAQLLPHILAADLVVIEGQSFNARGRSHFSLAELHGVLHLACFKSHVETVVVPPATLKKWATGDGRATKDQMLEAARQKGADPANYDEADSYHLRAYGVSLSASS